MTAWYQFPRIRGFSPRPNRASFYCWASGGAEVDFLIQRGNEFFHARRVRHSRAQAGPSHTNARCQTRERPTHDLVSACLRRDEESESTTTYRSAPTARRSYSRRRARCNSSAVIMSVHVPARFVSSAMRRRRLNSVIAVTMASRLVRAFVNRMASSSSPSGISTVVFMPPI